jgi:hypothetical protein
MARERVNKGVEGAFIPPHPECSCYSFKTRSIRGKPGNSGKSEESGVNPDTPAFQGQHPRKDPRECVGAKVSLIGLFQQLEHLFNFWKTQFLSLLIVRRS